MSTFVPQFSYISGITNEVIPTVSFTAPHDFTVGEIISFRVSQPYGMVEINNQQALVLSVASSSVTINLSTLQFPPFINAGLNQPMPAMAVPSASGIVPNSIPVTINLIDAFDNVPVN